MSQPIPVDILSDSDTDSGGNRRWDLRTEAIDLITPPPSLQSKKKQRTEAFSNPSNSTVFIIDDDPTPCKKSTSSLGPTSSPTPSVVPETPFSDASIVKCGSLATDQFVVADTPMREPLESRVSIAKCNAGNHSREPACSIHNDTLWSFLFSSIICGSCDDIYGIPVQLQKKPPTQNPVEVQDEGSSSPSFVEDDACLACEDKASTMDPVVQMPSRQDNNGCRTKEKKKAYETMKLKRISKEERIRLMEEKKQLKEQEKLLKAASKAEAAEMKKYKKEMQKWEKGKYALKSIVAEIDKKVVELGSIGGHLLTRFAEKGLTYHITSNPMERTIVWTMVVPEEISVEKEAEGVHFQYNLEKIQVSKEIPMIESSMTMLQIASEPIEISVFSIIILITLYYATNRLMAYINKREQAQYKNPANYSGWKRPAIEEVLARLATHFFKVHSRHCVDEAEFAEHVVGLTCSLASCQFRLKALVAIPKVQPRFAMAIWKEYPTMKSLLSLHGSYKIFSPVLPIWLNPYQGDERRLGEVCSKRIYRILMAQCGNIKTDDVENGAGFFTHIST
ncbi:UNVERIFIED_CONTAM: Crossover junction endonuclease EME1B [Sesamum calycinum]|uniref:Crossover junction endonuclease EME1B n=1 Tax=Sesamum calycinum TaxID=2727403 RepID=A0AAW2ST25_9LAMI